MKSNWFNIALIGCFVLFLAGCSQIVPPTSPEKTVLPTTEPIQIDSTQAGPDSPSQAEDTQMTPSLLAPDDTGIQRLVEKAKEDLAQRLSISISQINLLEAREIVWSDASLGCPQPGMVYAQVQVDGLLIRLGVGKEMYFYHSEGTADPFLCEGTSQVLPIETPKTDEFVPPPDSDID